MRERGFFRWLILYELSMELTNDPIENLEAPLAKKATVESSGHGPMGKVASRYDFGKERSADRGSSQAPPPNFSEELLVFRAQGNNFKPTRHTVRQL